MNYKEVLKLESIEFSFGDYRDWFLFDKEKKETTIESEKQKVSIHIRDVNLKKPEMTTFFTDNIPKCYKEFKIKLKRIKDIDEGKVIVVFSEIEIGNNGAKSIITVHKLTFNENNTVEISGTFPESTKAEEKLYKDLNNIQKIPKEGN